MTDDIIYQIIVIGLFLLFIISLTLFIQKLLIRSKNKNNQLMEIGKKLDNIIEIMEKDKKS